MAEQEKYFSTLNGYKVKDQEARNDIQTIHVRDLQVRKVNTTTILTVTDKNGEATSVLIEDGAQGPQGPAGPAADVSGLVTREEFEAVIGAYIDEIDALLGGD